MQEKYWEDETNPSELRRRARDLFNDGMIALAQQLSDRANYIEKHTILRSLTDG